MAWCAGCKQEVVPVPGQNIHAWRSAVWTGEDTPQVCGPVYASQVDALQAQLREALSAVDSLIASDEEWAEEAAWVALVEPGGLVESVRDWLAYSDSLEDIPDFSTTSLAWEWEGAI